MSKQKPSSLSPTRTGSNSGPLRQPLRQRRRTPKDSAPEQAGRRSSASDGAFREIVESIVIAFVLAFLFRTFEAEAFVIPTGSMAPTMMGRHKDVVCEKCGFPYQISASEEVHSESGQPVISGKRPVQVVAGTCPNCRYTMYFGAGSSKKETSYKGDRILVAKFPYDFRDPQRWDVAVFKYPGGAETNFIKRVVGLPEETVKISHGDILTKRDGERRFTIARKPPLKLEAMLQPVYDNDYVLPEIIQQGWPARWSPVPPGGAGAGGQWKTSEDHRSFRTDGSAPGEVWLRYQHFVPSFRDWEHLEAGEIVHAGTVRPQLITDYTAYNTNVNANGAHLAPSPNTLGLHWAGDLVIEGVVDVDSTTGEFLLELVEGGRRFQCRLDVATGLATLSIDGLEGYRPVSQTEMSGPGGYHVRFANVDDQLLLWINKSLVEFDRETAYPRLNNLVPTPNDLEPVRIGSRGAALRLNHLKLSRDLYYIAAELGSSDSMMSVITDFRSSNPPWPAMRPEQVVQFLSDPREWGVFRTLREVEFTLEEDQFLMLGDNSAESKDSRLWDNSEFYVRRDLLIGKALYTYWPHSFNRLPGTTIWFPFFPNVARMGFVR